MVKLVVVKIKTKDNSLERIFVVVWLFGESDPKRYFLEALNDEGDSLKDEEGLSEVTIQSWFVKSRSLGRMFLLQQEWICERKIGLST